MTHSNELLYILPFFLLLSLTYTHLRERRERKKEKEREKERERIVSENLKIRTYFSGPSFLFFVIFHPSPFKRE